MPTFTVPSSYGTLREYNTCHSPEDGKFCSTPGGGGGAKKAPAKAAKAAAAPAGPAAKKSPYERPKVAVVEDIDEAVARILKGEVVELKDVKAVNTVLTKLATMALDAQRRGEKAPSYDLCKVSVPGTNLFCHSKLRTTKYPEGVPRIEMPQFGGQPVPGSQADKLPKSDKGNVDGGPAFIRHMTNLGIRVESTPKPVPASRLKASQAELVGPQVAQMMTDTTFDPAKDPIFVSRDGYVIDGHHRWAAVVGRDAADGRLGNSKMNVVKVDAPISEILILANQWANDFGIAPKAGKR